MMDSIKKLLHCGSSKKDKHSKQQDNDNIGKENSKLNLSDSPMKDIELDDLPNQQFYEAYDHSSMFLSNSKLNPRTTLFFKIGSNNIQNEDILTQVSSVDDITQWSQMDDPDNLVKREHKLPKEVKELLTGRNLPLIMYIGQFVTLKNFWGFCLNLKSVHSVYQGQIDQRWFKILSLDQFKQVFRRYAFQVLDQEATGDQYLTENAIPTSCDDESVDTNLINLNGKLLSHQEREVGWMSKTEYKQSVEINIDLAYIPFLDTGFQFDSNNAKSIIPKSELKSKKQELPGGVLASQVGSGKTVSTIALITIGANQKCDCEDIHQKCDSEDAHRKCDCEDAHQKCDCEDAHQKCDCENAHQKCDQEEFKAGDQIPQKVCNQQCAKLKDKIIDSNLNKVDEYNIQDNGNNKINKYDPISDDNDKYNKYNKHNEHNKLKSHHHKMGGENDSHLHPNKITNTCLPSLIIVTENILHQWAQEFQTFAPTLKLLMIENQEHLLKLDTQNRGTSTLPEHFDVVLTHRDLVIKCFQSNKQPKSMLNINQQRVVLDELHEITSAFAKKNSEKKAQTFFEENITSFQDALKLIKRNFTWGLTGTPQNLNQKLSPEICHVLNIDYSLFSDDIHKKLKDAFIKSHMRCNSSSVKLPPLNKSINIIKFGQLQKILQRGNLKGNSESVARELCSHFLDQFNYIKDPETTIYDQAIKAVQAMQSIEIGKYKKLIAISNSKQQQEQWQSRLDGLVAEGNFQSHLMELISKQNFDCPICMETLERNQLVVMECMHEICCECQNRMTKNLHIVECPICRTQNADGQVIVHPRMLEHRINKLEALLAEIMAVPKHDKVIIFTQFNDLRAKLAATFDEIEMDYMILNGDASEINISLHKFKSLPQIKILIMSIEQSASGINVFEANHVFFVHPVFGMEQDRQIATYNQCIGRAQRFGQTKQVHAKLFVVKDSVEEEVSRYFV